MTFLWPQFLAWMPLVLVLLPAAYVVLLRRGKPALRYSSVAAVRAALGGRNWRRHVPPALLWLACAVLLFAAARPLAKLTLPWARTSILLAMDVSLSMRVSDVQPTRIAAAQDAAKLFLRDLPRGIEVGLVTFAGNAQVVQTATLDRSALVSAIDGFQLQLGTAVGDAIVLCLAQLFPNQGLERTDTKAGAARSPLARRDKEPLPAATQAVAPVAPGSYGSAAILLLSDGRRTTGVDTLEAAKLAADRGVRVHVVGLGTVDGPVGTGEGLAIYMQLDEPTLREVARMTGGEYHHAGTAEELRSVYQGLGSRLQMQQRETELTAPLALVAAVLLAAAMALSMRWSGPGL